jgi:tripartite ATP-independent transporter DctP family solute receptor
MKKRIASLGIVLVACLLAAGCSNSNANPASGGAAASSPAAGSNTSAESVKLVLGHTNPENDLRNTMALQFAKLVSEKSNGKVTVDVFSSAKLGNGQEEIEGLRMGTQDILVEGYAIMAMFSDKCMDVLPYLYRDYEHFMKCWYDSKVGELWIQYAAEVGFTAFGPSYRGFRNLTSMRSVTTAKDAEGLKIRTPSTEPFVSTWKNLKAQATPMDLSEVIPGLQQGTIEATENTVVLSYNMGLADICKYLTMTKHACGADIYMMDTKRFDKLPKEYQTVIIDAANTSAKEISKTLVDLEPTYVQKFADKGAKVINPDINTFNKAFESFVSTKFPKMSEIAGMIAAVK